MKLAFDGQEYTSNIEKMLDSAYDFTSTKLFFNKEAYQNRIIDRLYYGANSLVISKRSKHVSQNSIEYFKNIYTAEQDIKNSFNQIIDNITNVKIASVSLCNIIDEIDTLKNKIKESNLKNVDIEYNIYTEDHNGNFIIKNSDLTLGNIAQLEKTRTKCLNLLDNDLKIKQLTTVTSSASSILDLSSIFCDVNYVYGDNNILLESAEKVSFVESIVNFEIEKEFTTSARDEVICNLPQNMLLNLSGEIANVLVISNNFLNYIMKMVKPSGGYSAPVEYTTYGNTLPLKGWAESPAGIDHVVFTAFYDGIWHKIYSDNTKPYEYTWDLSNISEMEIILGFDIYAKNGAVAESPNGTVKIYHSKTVDDFDPPAKPKAPQDQGSEINSTNLTFTWAPSTDSQSGIKGYRLTLNSYPNWENASTDRYGANIYTKYVADVNSYTFNVGSPHVGRVIRAAVKAVDKAGNESEWSALSDGIEIKGSSKIPPPENSLVRTSGTDKVYIFKDGRKWWIINQNIFGRLGLQESEIIVYQPGVLDNYPDGPNIFSEGSLIRKEESDAVYLIDDGKRRHVSYDAFIHGNYEWKNVFDVPVESWTSIVAIFPEGEEIGWDNIPPSVTIVTPSGGETWLSGEQKTIRWTATDDIEVDHVDLYFTIDGWATSREIAKGLANDGQYNWTVPDRDTSEVAIRVEAFDDSGNSGSGYSDHFTITNSGAEPPSTPIIYNPGKIATRNQVTLRWQKVVDSNHEDNVEYYEIEYADNLGFDASTKINAGNPATGSNIYETLSYLVTGLKDNKTYYFRIMAVTLALSGLNQNTDKINS